MTKKIQLILLILGFSFLLFGCGASVEQTLILDDNFSGARVFDVHVDNESLDRITGGADALTDVLTKNKPAILEMTTYQDPDGNGIRYQFLYEFDTIETYIEKTQSILGTDFNATFEEQKNPDNPFELNLVYEETGVSRLLLQWAIDAVAASGITAESSDSFITSHEYRAQFKEIDPNIYENDTASFNLPFALKSKRVDVLNDLDHSIFSISTVFDSSEISMFDPQYIESLYKEKGAVKVTKSNDEVFFTYEFERLSDYQSFLRKYDIGTFVFDTNGSNPVRKSAHFDTYISASALLDYYLESQQGAVFEIKGEGYFDDSCEYYTDMTIDEQTEDHFVLSSTYSDAMFSFDFNKSLIASRVHLTRTLESRSSFTTEFEVELDPSSAEQYDMDAVVQYFEKLGIETEYKKGKSPKLILTRTFDLNSTSSNLFNTVSFYETHKSSIFSDSKIHLLDFYDFDQFIQSDDHVDQLRINHQLDIETIEFNGMRLSQEELKEYEKGDYYVLSAEGNSNWNSSIVIRKKAFPIIPVTIGIVCLLAIAGFAGVVLKKRKNSKIVESEIISQ